MIVVAGGTITLTAGDDYYAADGRALTWTGATADQWPNLTGATLRMYVGDGRLSVTGSVTTPTGIQVLQVEVSHTQTALLTKASYPYDVKAALTDGHVVTLARGTVNVVDSEAS